MPPPVTEAPASAEPLALDDVLITDALARRPPRAADLAAENAALHRISREMQGEPLALLQALMDVAVELCCCGVSGTAGVSLLEQIPGAAPVFRWTAMSGTLAAAVGGTTPRDFSPCGVCLDAGEPVLFSRPDLRFTYFLATGVPFVEGLILPFHVDGEAAGAVWVVSHDEARRFDSEDVRVMESLAAFTGTAYTLVRSRSAAEEGSRAKGEFLAVLSHELRTPLNAIGGYAELLEAGVHGTLDGAQLSALARIRDNQRHLKALIEDLLSFSRGERGELPLTLTDVPVDEILAEVASATEPLLEAAGLSYTAEMEGAGGHTVRADAERVHQILVNLLGNAAKFTEPGGRVHLTCSAGGGEVRFEVRDTGIGIPPERLSAIFDPFVQIDSRLTRTSGGVGLGLAICRQLARRMGGDIRVRSTPGAGSAFTLHLPG